MNLNLKEAQEQYILSKTTNGSSFRIVYTTDNKDIMYFSKTVIHHFHYIKHSRNDSKSQPNFTIIMKTEEQLSLMFPRYSPRFNFFKYSIYFKLLRNIRFKMKLKCGVSSFHFVIYSTCIIFLINFMNHLNFNVITNLSYYYNDDRRKKR